MEKKFIDAINANDYIALRDMLKNRLLLDHDVIGGAFSQCWNECEKAGITQSIFQLHDGREISKEVTENNYNILVGQLSTNFSETRLNNILSIAKRLWPNEQSVEEKNQSETIKSSSYNTTYENEDGRVVSERIIEVKEIPHENSHNSSERMNYSNNNKNDSNFGVVVAVAAVAVVAVIAGVVIFG